MQSSSVSGAELSPPKHETPFHGCRLEGIVPTRSENLPSCLFGTKIMQVREGVEACMNDLHCQARLWKPVCRIY